MAKIVIAGASNCPHFARIELLADQLDLNLPSFHLHKIIKQPQEWQDWLETECSKNGWHHHKSPLVWRELVDRGGKGVLIGGANEFQEYVNAYYQIQSSMVSKAMRNVAEDNARFKDAVDSEDRYLRSLSKPLKVCITNAASPCAYNLMPLIARGDVFGEDEELNLILCDSEDKTQQLEGIQMEICDLSTKLVRQITITNEFEMAVANCSVVVILDELNQGEEESREEWLRRNAEHYSLLACTLDNECNIDTKVLVCGSGPLNFCVYMMLQSINRIQRFNIVALPRFFERQVKAVLAAKMNVNSSGVTDVIVWGNPTGECHIDLSRCRVYGFDGAITGPQSFSLATQETIWDKKWQRTELMPLCAERAAKIAELKNGQVANALAKAHSVASFLTDWWNGSSGKQIYSLGVRSAGWYGIPEGLVYSFPVIFHPKGYWSVVEDMELTEEGYARLNDCVKDLIAEKEVIFPTAAPDTDVTDMFSSSFAPTAIGATSTISKTPMEKLLDRIEDQHPEYTSVLKNKLLDEATADELVLWVDNAEIFIEKVQTLLEDEGLVKNTKAEPSSDEMMTANESDGVHVTDEESAALKQSAEREEAIAEEE